MNMFLEFYGSESGQDLTEYALLVAFVSLASILALTALGTTINGYWLQKAADIARAVAG
jgi:Flp pilus assembly pilin Flp